MTKNTGGSAYPQLQNSPFGGASAIGGLTKQEVYAIAALQGYLSKFADVNSRTEYAEDAARFAFKIADAMIEESQK